MKVLFECQNKKNFPAWLQACNALFITKHQWNTEPFHFKFHFNFWVDFSEVTWRKKQCNCYGTVTMVIFLGVKMTCFCAKGHVAFLWYFEFKQGLFHCTLMAKIALVLVLPGCSHWILKDETLFWDIESFTCCITELHSHRSNTKSCRGISMQTCWR